MHKPVSALNTASYDTGIAQVTALGPQGMITLRGDMTAKPLKKAVASVTGLTLPEQRQCVSEGADVIAWMSPDELLVMCPYVGVQDRLAALEGKLSKMHALAVNVSDARAVIELRGPHAREVLAKVSPVDLAPASFTTGMFRRSRIAQVPAAFWMPQEDVLRIICFRSAAQYVFDVLRVAAQPGSEVGMFNS